MEGEQKILFLFVQMMSGDSTSSASSDDTDYQPQEGVVLLDPCTEDEFLPKVDERSGRTATIQFSIASFFRLLHRP